MNTLKHGAYFITGIDTDIGKSYVTGLLAKTLLQKGVNVITQKFIQTGCSGISEDIEMHRRLMGIPLQEVDKNGTTCPEIFKFPASPHLAARLEGKSVDLAKISNATKTLQNMYDVVLIEGAGGLMVPINDEYTTADYVVEHGLPILLVTSPRLGSINHTLLTLEVCRNRGIEVEGVIYNHYPEVDDVMKNDTFDYICKHVLKHNPTTKIYETENLY